MYELTNLDTVKVETFRNELSHELQRRRSMITSTVNTYGIAQGNTVHWPFMGEIGKPGPKSPAGDIPITNPSHRRETVTVEPEYLGTYEDKFDQVLVNWSARAALIQGMGMSLERWMDDKIISILNGATKQIDGSAGQITLAQTKALVAWFDEQYVPPNDRYVAVSPGVFTDLMEIQQFADGDWTDQKQWTSKGIDARRWLGMTWYAVNGLNKVGDVVDCVAYARMAVGWHLIWGGEISVDWVPHKASYLIQYAVAGAGTILHPNAVVRLKVQDTASNLVV